MILDVLGLASTLLALALLGLGGYLLALRLLGEAARRDALALAIATLLAATGEAIAIALALGICGWLRIEAALAVQALLVAVLWWTGRAADLDQPARHLAKRSWERLRSHPALAILTAHAVGSEALRGLLRPPLSWDSLMYHLLLTASWLQRHDLAPVLGAVPVNYYGYVPANGSLWFWWWMAPSHGELYVNLASLPHWALLGLAVGGIARQLGARRHWPLAAFPALLTPVVVRFAATEYVDLLLASTLLAGAFFLMRWMERPSFADAVLAGAACGLACGTKVLGAPYAAALAAAAIALAPWRPRAPGGRGGPGAAAGPGGPALPGSPGPSGAPGGRPRSRLAQLAAALLAAAALGSFFYARNLALGAGPLALVCEGREGKPANQVLPARPARPAAPVSPPAAPQAAPSPPAAVKPAAPPAVTPEAATPPAVTPRAAARSPQLPALPRPGSVADQWPSLRRQLLDAFLGITRPHSLELGIGPQTFVLLLAALALPFAVAAQRRRAALLAVSQIGFELLFWLLVPFGANLHIFANVRYLVPAMGLAFAGAVAIAEEQAMSEPWLRGIALALACQGMLTQHAEMPREVRVTIGVLDVLAVSLALSAGLRAWARRRAATLAAATLLLALLGAPALARFRAADRYRALAEEWTAHASSMHLFAGGWGWLDAHGGTGTVAVTGSPGTYFVYPAMGAFLQRRTLYVNVNRANHPRALDYPGCNPRVDAEPEAWLRNLDAAGVRWLLIDRYREFDPPIEASWAAARPDRFGLRYTDGFSTVFEVLR